MSSTKLQYPKNARSRRTKITVYVVWLEDAVEVDKVCAQVIGEKPEGRIMGCYDPNYRTIYAIEPVSFNDHDRLETLGHEFWHALGAVHP